MASTPDPDNSSGGYRNAPTSAPPSPSPNSPPTGGFSLNGVLVVDTSQLQNAVAGFQTVAGDVNAAVQQALSQTQGGSLEADPWGSDPLGSAFGAQYQPAAEQFTQALGLLSPMFGQIANTLDTAVKLATAGNDNAIEIAQSINKGI